MTPASVPLRVEVRVPRAFYDLWPTSLAVEAALRAAGVLPRYAQEVRWRMDPVNAGYLVSYTLALTATHLETLHAMVQAMPKEAP